MFGTLGGPELFLIFVVALIVFGPRKLPEIGKSLGRMMAEFRKASNDFRSTIESEVEAEKIREAMRIEPPRVDPTPIQPPAAPAAAPAGEPASGPSQPEHAGSATHERAAETVSRQPEPTPIEPK
jgi:Tat protein translocase TatB subunit